MVRLAIILMLLIHLGSHVADAKDRPAKERKQKKEHRIGRLFKRKHHPSNSMLLPAEAKHAELLLPGKKSSESSPISGS